VRSRFAALLVAALTLSGTTVLSATAAHASAPTQPPALTAPIGTSVSSNPTLQWRAVAGAAGYRVQVSTSSSFATLNFDRTTVGHQLTPDQDLPLGTLFWRVAASDTGGALGPYSAAAQFTKTWDDAPTPTAPDDDAQLKFPTNPAVFAWEPLPGASSYTLEIDNADDFIGAADYTTSNTTYALTTPQTFGQTFFWRVRGVSPTSGVVSAWSTPRSYGYNWDSHLTLIAPANTNLDPVTDVKFDWKPVDGAQNYELQVSPNGDWANNVTIDQTLVATSYTPAQPLQNGSYFWRVRANDAAGDHGTWSDAWTFTRGWTTSPSIVSPAWDPNTGVVPIVSTNLALQWTPTPHAAYYELQVSTDQNFSPSTSVTKNCYTNHTQWTPYLLVSGSAVTPGTCALDTYAWASGTTYYWRVRGIDAAGAVLGLWSSVSGTPARFIRDPGRPAYVSPADGDTVSVPTMTWQPVTGAEHYKVTLKKANGTVVGGFPVTTYATSYTPTAALTPAEGPYTWYVQSVDGTGLASAIPAHLYQFSVANDATTTDTPTLTAPDDQASFQAMPALAWTPMTGAAKYTVHYASNGFEQTPLMTNDGYPAYTYTGVTLAAGTYEWWVEAFTSAGNHLGTSATRTFKIVSPQLELGSGDYTAPDRCSLVTSCTAVQDTPTLTWNADPYAGAYLVTIANDPHFTNVVRTYITAYTTLTPRESLLDSQAGQAYYWFVRPCVDYSPNGQPTRCGPGPEDDTANPNAGAFRKRSNPVVLTSPGDQTTQANQITFKWQDYLNSAGATGDSTQEAKQYRIQVSTAADFATTLDTQVVDATSYTPTNLTYPEGPLYWHVQAIDASGNNLTWSDTATAAWKVTKQSPAPDPATMQPANNTQETGVPYLSWAPLDYSSGYTIELYKNGDTNFTPANRLFSMTTKFSAWAPTTGLPAGDYAWRVRALDPTGKSPGNPGPWSNAMLFHLNPSAPTLVAPEPGFTATSGDLLFAWAPGAGAVPAQYLWQLSANAGFSSVTSSAKTVMTSWSPLTTIPDGSFFWRVQELDGNGNVLATSAPSALFKDAKAPTVTVMPPTSNVAVTGAMTATFSEPVTHVSTSTFQVKITGTKTAINGVVRSPNTTTATWTPSEPLTPGQHYTVTLTSGIRDVAGNPLVAKSEDVRAATLVENTSAPLTEHWDRDSSTRASGHSVDASDAAGSTASFTFTGTNLTVLGTQAKSGGYAAVYLDGKLQTSKASFYSSGTHYQHTIWSKSKLTDTAHTVTVKVLGTKPAHATGSWVYLDAFKVGTVKHEQTAGSVHETFRRVHSSSASGGSYDTATHTTSGDTSGRPYYSVTFRGTRATVYGTRSNSSGTAVLYVDNVKRATYDLRGPTLYRAIMFSTPTLSDKLHTIRVEVSGTKSGARSSVGLDDVLVS
jgi:hypothetical protein